MPAILRRRKLISIKPERKNAVTLADREIPLHVFHFDCYWMDAYEWCNFEWDPATFPDPKGMLKRYHDRGLHICVYVTAFQTA